jgi:hypothetical protein
MTYALRRINPPLQKVGKILRGYYKKLSKLLWFRKFFCLNRNCITTFFVIQYESFLCFFRFLLNDKKG